VIKKEGEKILKYQDLTIEIECIWVTKTEVIQVIIRTTGNITKSFIKYLSNITGKHEIKALQKAMVGNAHIQRKGLITKLPSR
jgi:Zn-finger protein